MIRTFTPDSIAPPGSGYHHGAEVAPGARWLHMSGQVGRAPDGTLEEGIRAQTDRCWQNIMAILKEAGMGTDNIVKVTSYLTRREDLPAFREARDTYIGELKPASTLVLVAALAHPDMLVEVDVIAAAP